VQPVAAWKTRVWIAQGRLDEAHDWAKKQGLSANDGLSYLREFEHITLARILLAKYHGDPSDHVLLEATGLLERLLQAAQAGGRMASVIEVLILQALAHQAHGDLPAALQALNRALTLAEPEGYVRIFVDEGPDMAQLLLQAAAHGMLPDYTGRLLEAFDLERPPALATANGEVAPARPPVASQPLIEPLSQRELEIMRLFRTELSGPEIADELVIALSTVRTHTKSIYSKLNVNNRRAAVNRAAELGLI